MHIAIDKTNETQALGTIIKKVIDQKSDSKGIEMFLVQVDQRKFPYRGYKYGKRDFKVSNLKFVRGKIKEGSYVEGSIFSYKKPDGNGFSHRFHIKAVLNY